MYFFSVSQMFFDEKGIAVSEACLEDFCQFR